MKITNEHTILRRIRLMLAIIVSGLFLSGVTVWPALTELRLLVRLAPMADMFGGFLPRVIESLETVQSQYPFLLYAHDWLAFAHIVLAILFAGAMRDPVRNVWIVQCGLIMCALVPVLAGVCVPLRGLPAAWFWVDAAFAPAAGIPLWIALRGIRRIEEMRTRISATID